MKEIIGMSTLNEVKEIVIVHPQVAKAKIVPIHCSMCANCSGIVGD
jgi:hypothetical protein